MDKATQQQIVISGVGGQGVLFVTRLMAEAAINKNLPVFTSETHGMAQRGGTVLSHLKVGDFSSPLIRPFQADGLVALKAESMDLHGSYLKPGGWVALNESGETRTDLKSDVYTLDADRLARRIENPRSVNLIVLGFAMGTLSKRGNAEKSLFCNLDDIKAVLQNRLASKKKMLAAAIHALETGYQR